jgi:5-methylcytosine-specific restriction endonuclease McrA
MMISRLVLVLCLLLASAPTWASSNRSSSRSSARTSSRSESRTSSKKCTTCVRDSRGRIVRSRTARSCFMQSHPCPSTGKTYGACKGYVIDHVVPLKRGGADAPSNMQWQTTAEAKAKDKIE